MSTNQPVFDTPPPTTVIRIRERILTSIEEFAGAQLTGELFKQFVETVANSQTKPFDVDTIYDSSMDLLGKAHTIEGLRDYAWRLAGNSNLLRNNQPVGVWLRQHEEEWCPVHVLSAERCRRFRSYDDRKGELAYSFKLRVLAGSPCPMILTKIWRPKFCRIVANNIGFSPSYGKYPFSNALEFVNLRFLVLIDPKVCYKDKPGFEDVAITSSIKQWNRGIMKSRQRIGYQCPEEHDVPCHQCWRGYNSCIAACRSKDMIWQFCCTCKEESWFEHYESSSTGDAGVRCSICHSDGRYEELPSAAGGGVHDPSRTDNSEQADSAVGPQSAPPTGANT